jgi:hypothetical protein
LSSSKEVYEKSLAGQWYRVGCDSDEERPFYVFKSLVLQLIDPELSPFENNSQNKWQLAAVFLDPQQCPGARRPSKSEKTELENLRDSAPPTAPKQ